MEPRLFERRLRSLPGQWTFLSTPDELTKERLLAIAPRYVFFLHWSARVPDDVVERFECVCFHMTDVPYGRGGSPLQNLILRGHRTTKLTALRMTAAFDAGPVYEKRPLSLEGTAQEIYERAGEVSADIIAELIVSEPTPSEQEGEPVVFQRRRPEESELPRNASPEALYDFIRMLDADGYPRAFIRHGALRLELSGARLDVDTGELRAQVRVISEEPKE